jgi:predicted enzyme related to lactoylglutathione lyase
MANAAVMYVTDLDKMVQFYAQLGLKLEETKRGEYAVLAGLHFEMSFIQSPRPLASQINASKPPQAREQTPIKLVFIVPSIDVALEAGVSLGGQIKADSRKWQFRGHTIQDAIDLEGNVYQLRELL